jgi:hypothetical protein
LNRKVSVAARSPVAAEYTASASTSTPRIGISTLDAVSMPAPTPRATMVAVIAMNSACQPAMRPGAASNAS